MESGKGLLYPVRTCDWLTAVDSVFRVFTGGLVYHLVLEVACGEMNKQESIILADLSLIESKLSN